MKIKNINTAEYYCLQRENQFFDRKSARIKPIDILKHLVAFANFEEGKLVIGILMIGDYTEKEGKWGQKKKNI